MLTDLPNITGTILSTLFCPPNMYSRRILQTVLINKQYQNHLYLCYFEWFKFYWDITSITKFNIVLDRNEPNTESKLDAKIL